MPSGRSRGLKRKNENLEGRSAGVGSGGGLRGGTPEEEPDERSNAWRSRSVHIKGD
ncbi:hypothetical protein KSP40_PGU020830 [Platanthera guangdongensis]|uniref:Uncharacterized protein n=1 Tax=Platanthera guangdongensis TaxID=2320717 RepID=A0ABR2LYF5_9ASPA